MLCYLMLYKKKKLCELFHVMLSYVIYKKLYKLFCKGLMHLILKPLV